jgi:hypothetical protein
MLGEHIPDSLPAGRSGGGVERPTNHDIAVANETVDIHAAMVAAARDAGDPFRQCLAPRKSRHDWPNPAIAADSLLRV